MITSTFLGNTRRTRWLCLKREIWYLCSISIVTTAISTTVLAVGDLGFIRWPWTQTLDCSVDSAGSITLQSTSPPTARMTTGPIRSRCIHQAEPASSMLQRTQWHRRAVRKASKQKKHAASTASCMHVLLFVPEIRMWFASSAIGLNKVLLQSMLESPDIFLLCVVLSV